MHRHTRGERGLDRWASSTSHDSTDRSIARPRLDAPTRLDDARRPWRCETRRTTPPSGANPRDRRRNCASYRAGASRTIDRSTGRPIARARRHSPRGIRMETTATDGLFAPRRARARRMDRMRRMSASGDGTMSARKQAPSSARRLSRPSAYGACDARWDDDLIRARWKRTNE